MWTISYSASQFFAKPANAIDEARDRWFFEARSNPRHSDAFQLLNIVSQD
jgi:hypothetical protein